MDALQVTQEIFARIRRGDRHASDELLPHVYEELRTLARRQLRGERAGHTLQPTALVHEAFLRLAGAREATWRERSHFVMLAARAMRRILVEHARARRRQKRGGPAARQRVSLDEMIDSPHLSAVDLIALDWALDRLAATNVRKARTVELLYFGGFTAAEAARLLGVTTRTIERDWAFARAWLLREMTGCRTGKLSSRGH